MENGNFSFFPAGWEAYVDCHIIEITEQMMSSTHICASNSFTRMNKGFFVLTVSAPSLGVQFETIQTTTHKHLLFSTN